MMTDTDTIVAHPVSLFRGVSDTTVVETVPLQTVLERIRTGVYRAAIAPLQALKATDEAAYTAQKAQLLAFTPACALTTRAKDVPWETKLQGCTGLAHFDIDHVRDVHALKAHLRQHPAMVFVFTSPGGDGLKCGVAATGITDAATYHHVWRQVFAALKTTLAALDPDATLIDTHVKYLHALCFVSDDPTLYLNPHAVPMEVPPPPPPATDAPRCAPTDADYDRVAAALGAIPNQDEYHTWLAVGMALHSTGAAWARDLWDTWSQQSPKYADAAQDKKWRSFTPDGGVTITTLFHRAQEAGWRDARAAGRPSQGQTPSSARMGRPPGRSPGASNCCARRMAIPRAMLPTSGSFLPITPTGASHRASRCSGGTRCEARPWSHRRIPTYPSPTR